MINHGVRMYLDEDTRVIPAGVTATSFVDRVNRMLQKIDPELYLTSVTAFGAFPNYKQSMSPFFHHRSVKFHFRRLPIRVHRCRTCAQARYHSGGNDKSDLSYLKHKEAILADMDGEIHRVKSLHERYPILISTSDSDFKRVVVYLKKAGFKVLLFTNSDTRPKVKKVAHITIIDDWK